MRPQSSDGRLLGGGLKLRATKHESHTKTHAGTLRLDLPRKLQAAKAGSLHAANFTICDVWIVLPS